MKHTYITKLSVLAVGIVFILQALLVYHLYQANVNLLQRELNVIAQSAYNLELNLRLGSKDGGETPNIQFRTTPPPGVDTTKIPRMDARSLNKKGGRGLVSAVTIAMEEFISRKHPIQLQVIDSLAAGFLKESGINVKFYSEIVDVENKGLRTTCKDSIMPTDTLCSKDIPLNIKQTKALRLVIISPKWGGYPNMGWMLALSLILSIFCIWSLYNQMKVLAKQKELATVKNEFFYEISHEFKRPLSVLLQSIDSFRNEKTNPEKKEHMLKIANQEIQRMISKTEMLLSLAQEEEGLFSLNCTEIDLVKIVFDLADNAIDTTPGSVEIDVDNELKNPIILADEDHVEQMLSNLVGNAIKYSKEDSVNIYIKLYQENNNVCISVRDTGVGISPEYLDVIFEKYSRVGKTTHARGHGIGLHYVNRIVKKHGGSISVESQLNVGSEFIVKLPLAKV